MKSEGLSFVAVSRCRLLVAVFLSLLLVSCGSHQDDTGGPVKTGAVNFTVEWEPPSDPAPSGGPLNLFPGPRPRAHVNNVCEDYGIDYVILQILDNSMSPHFPESTIQCIEHQGIIKDVPVGDNLQLRLIGKVLGIEKWTGFSSKFNLTAGGSSDAGLITMTYTFRGTGWDNTPPVVVTTTPSYGAVNVQLNSTLKILFSESMARNSVEDNEAIRVVDNTTPTPQRISGSIIYYPIDNSAVFYPSVPLSFGLTHTVTIDNVMTDMAARPLTNAPYTWTFRAHRSGEWGPPFPISDNTGGRRTPGCRGKRDLSPTKFRQGHGCLGYWRWTSLGQGLFGEGGTGRKSDTDRQRLWWRHLLPSRRGQQRKRDLRLGKFFHS